MKIKPCYSKDILNNRKLSDFGIKKETYFCDCGSNKFYKLKTENKKVCVLCGVVIENE